MELNTFIRAILTSLLVCWWEAGIIFLLIHFYFKGTSYNYLFSVKTGYFDFLKFKYWNKSWHFVLIIRVGGIWWNEMGKVLHQSIVDWIKCSILALILFQCIRDGLFIYYTKYSITSEVNSRKYKLIPKDITVRAWSVLWFYIHSWNKESIGNVRMTLKLDSQQMHLISGLLGHFAIKDLTLFPLHLLGMQHLAVTNDSQAGFFSS